MKNPLAPARSLRRDGKVSYITFLQLSSLTRRKSSWKIGKYREKWSPLVPRGTPRRTTVHQFHARSAAESAPLSAPPNQAGPRQLPPATPAAQQKGTGLLLRPSSGLS